MSETILVAIDGSDHAWKALDLAAEIAKMRSARLCIVHVAHYEPMPESLRAFARAEHIPIEEEEARFRYGRALGDELTRVAEERARGAGAPDVMARVAEGRPAEQILAMAEAEDAGMIVVGSRGLSDAKALLLGSVSHKVANRMYRSTVVRRRACIMRPDAGRFGRPGPGLVYDSRGAR